MKLKNLEHVVKQRSLFLDIELSLKNVETVHKFEYVMRDLTFFFTSLPDGFPVHSSKGKDKAGFINNAKAVSQDTLMYLR